MDDKRRQELERAREHQARMARAGEQFGEILDRSADEQNQATAEAIFEGLARKYGLNDDDDGEAPSPGSAA